MSDGIIGQILVGKYRVERILGQGGMGLVVEATHLQLHQRVAIKFVLPEALQNPEIRTRFLREAMAAARLRSAHVARVIDIGTLDSGSPFIVMELLEGEDLASILRRQGPLPLTTAAAWMLEACEALAEAHALGIVHRDLKPGNLFLASGAGGLRSIKVFDFGISKVTTGAEMEMQLTRTISVMGSPGYASPEQLRSTKNVDHRTDLWALGVTLYQLVSGDMPWKAQTLPELSIKIAIDPMPPLSPILRIPPAFERIIRRCLEKDPEQRYPNVAALAEALGPFAPNGPAAVDRVLRAGMASDSVGPPTTGSGSAGEVSAHTQSSRNRTRNYGIIVGAVVVLGTAVAVLASRPAGPTTTTTTTTTTNGTTVQVAHAVPDAPRAAVVVASSPDAAVVRPVVVASPPDAAVAAVVVVTSDPHPQPNGNPSGDTRPSEDHYRDFLAEARRLSHGSCSSGAVKMYEKAIDANPRAAEALAGLGSCLNQLGDYDRAISNFLGALAIAKKSPEALYGLAEAYQKKGNAAQAIANYKLYLEVAPRGDRAAQARDNLGRLGTPGGGKQSDDDLFGAGSGKPR